MRISDCSSDVCSSDLVFFILALRGLSSPASSRRGNRFGMAGMAIAVVTTLVTHELANPIEVIGAIAIGAAIGLVMARKIDRKGVVWGKSVSVRVDIGGRRIIKKKKT